MTGFTFVHWYIALVVILVLLSGRCMTRSVGS